MSPSHPSPAAAPLPVLDCDRSSAAPSPTGLSASLRQARHLLRLASAGIVEASGSTNPAHRYAAAHLAALRAAAAVLAVRARPDARGSRRGRGSRNVWVLLSRVAPHLSEWAAYFSAGAPKRAAAEAGLPSVVTTREADDLLRDAELFLTVVQREINRAEPAPANPRSSAA